MTTDVTDAADHVHTMRGDAVAAVIATVIDQDHHVVHVHHFHHIHVNVAIDVVHNVVVDHLAQPLS